MPRVIIDEPGFNGRVTVEADGAGLPEAIQKAVCLFHDDKTEQVLAIVKGAIEHFDPSLIASALYVSAGCKAGRVIEGNRPKYEAISQAAKAALDQIQAMESEESE